MVRNWHLATGFDLRLSSFLVLVHAEEWMKAELFAFPLVLPDPETLTWEAKNDTSIRGIDTDGLMRCEFYPGSGGQVKLYMAEGEAVWRSGSFSLEVPPVTSLLARAQEYWPDA